MTVDQLVPNSGGPTPTIVDDLLDPVAAERLARSVPINTRLAYGAVAGTFERFCVRAGRVPLPAHDATLTAYVSHLITAEVAPATISQHIGAIRKMHSLAGYKGRPDAEQAQQLLRGYRRERAENGVVDRAATPLVAEALRKVIDCLPLDTTGGKRDQVLLVLGFTMMARRSELAALQLQDVRETGDGLEVSIRTSKTDKDSRGTVVALPAGSHPEADPVRLVRAWTALLGEHGITSGPLLRTVSRSGVIGGGVKPQTVNSIVRRCVAAAGLPEPDGYSAHSLRAGGLTSALRAGVPLGVAAAHGRWSPKSPVVIQYARAADRWRDNAMRGVL